MVVYGPFRQRGEGRRAAPETPRRRWDSNPCTGIARPLPEPLGHVAVSGHAGVTRTRCATIPDDQLRPPECCGYEMTRPLKVVYSEDRSTGLADRPSANPVGRICKLRIPAIRR